MWVISKTAECDFIDSAAGTYINAKSAVSVGVSFLIDTRHILELIFNMLLNDRQFYERKQGRTCERQRRVWIQN